MPGCPLSRGSLPGRRENRDNEASVFLHTADTYVAANDSVKYQGKSPQVDEAQFPPENPRARACSAYCGERWILPVPGLRALTVRQTLWAR